MYQEVNVMLSDEFWRHYYSKEITVVALSCNRRHSISFKGVGGSVTLRCSKLSLTLCLIEETHIYQMLFTELKNKHPSQSYRIFHF